MKCSIATLTEPLLRQGFLITLQKVNLSYKYSLFDINTDKVGQKINSKSSTRSRY